MTAKQLSEAKFNDVVQDHLQDTFPQFHRILPYITKRRYLIMREIQEANKMAAYLKTLYRKLKIETPLREQFPPEDFAEMIFDTAMRFAHENHFDIEQFQDFFPQHSPIFEKSKAPEKQYEKCRECDKKQNCGKNYSCLDIESIPVPETACEKALDQIMKLNDSYKRQLREYQARYEIWHAEYNTLFHLNDAQHSLNQFYTSSANIRVDPAITTLEKQNIRPEFVDINRELSKWIELDYWKQTGVYQVVFSYKESYISEKLNKLNLMKPLSPSPPAWGSIMCVDCRNVIDLQNVGEITSSQLSQINNCIIDSKGSIERPPEPKPVEPEPPKPKPTVPPEEVKPVPRPAEERKDTNTELYMIGGLGLLALILLGRK